MKIQWTNLRRQHLGLQEELKSVFGQTMNDGTFVLGPRLQQFEAEIAQYVGCKHGIGVKTGTDALFLSLKGLDIGPGDEVITTPFTFVSTVEVVALLGAKPVLCDIDPDTFNIDVDAIEDEISEKTKVIMPVHLYGQPAEMTRLMDIANKRDLIVVEDAAQALGAEYKGKKAGSWGRTSCVSFYPTKNLSCLGDGGMIITDDDQLTEVLRKLRIHGSSEQYRYVSLGYANRLDELQAAFLSIKLKHLDEWNERRRVLAGRYDEALREYVTIPPIDPHSQHVYHQYTIRTNQQGPLRSFLREQGIPSGVYYPLPLHLHPAYSYLGYKEGDFPKAETASKEVLSLPIDPHLLDDEHEWVVQNVVKFFRMESTRLRG